MRKKNAAPIAPDAITPKVYTNTSASISINLDAFMIN